VGSSSRILTLQIHNTDNSKYVFSEKELRGYSPNSYIHVSVSDLYIPLIGLNILLQENRWAECGICRSLKVTCMWKLGLRPRNSFSGNT
jgi:hypothetical protein